MSKKKLESYRSTLAAKGSSPNLGNIWLLSNSAFDGLLKGQVYLNVRYMAKVIGTTHQTHHVSSRLFLHVFHRYLATNNVKYHVFPNLFVDQSLSSVIPQSMKIQLENRTPQQTPIPKEVLIGIHSRFSEPSNWMANEEYVGLERGRPQLGPTLHQSLSPPTGQSVDQEHGS